MEKVKLSGSNGNSKSRVDPYSSKTTKSLLNQATSGNVSYTGLETGDDGAGEGGNDDKRQGGASSGCLKRMFANYGKSIVFGGIDGLLLALSICCASMGAALSFDAVLTLSVSCVVAGALKMGMDEFLSSKAHVEFVKAEKRRGLWEFKNYREEEVREMIKRFEEKGMVKADAELIVLKMASYEGLFVNWKVSEDLGLQLPEDKDDALILDMMIMVLSFFFFGAIPFVLYTVVQKIVLRSQETAADGDDNGVSALILILNLVVLFLVGSLKSTFSSVSLLRAGFETVVLGLICGGASFFVASSIVGSI